MESKHAPTLARALRVVGTTKEPAVSVGLPPHRLILRFITSGFIRANAELRLAFWLLAINILFAVMLTLPLYGLLDDSLGRSLMGNRSVAVPDVNWMMGFLHSNQGFLSHLSSTFLWVGLVYMLLNTLLAAGLLEVLSAEHPFSLRRFFVGIVAHGTKFLRLFGLSLVVYFIIVFVLNDLVGRGLDRWTRDWASEGGAFALYWLKNIVPGVALLFAIMVFDYAKIRLVMDRSNRVLTESLRALRFVRGRRWITLGVFYALGLVGVALALIYAGLDALLTPKSWWVLVPAFLVQQAFMFSRMWLRVAFYSSQMELYKQTGR